MQLQTTIRLGAIPAVSGPRVVRPHEERETRPVEAGSDAGNARARTSGEQAAVLHLGAQAVDRAQQGERAEAASTRAAPAAEGESAESLSDQEQRSLDDLRRRDLEVRSHEQTHRSVGAQYAGSIHLDYQLGADGKRYAVSGSTSIDVAAVPNDPAATLHKMEVVQRAATAPANPSGADRQVAAAASQQGQQARAEMAAERYAQARDLAPEKRSARDEVSSERSAVSQTRPSQPPSAAAADASAGPLLATHA
jgi:hypothetical protein